MSANAVPGPPSAGEAPPDWQALAFAFAALLEQCRGSQRAEAEHHAAELAQQRAAHARDRLHDRESLLDLVAHELKTPVAVIKA